MQHIKKFNEEIGDPNHPMMKGVTLKVDKYGDKSFNAEITLKINISVESDDDVISMEEAMKNVFRELDQLSGSNDGSELLANVSKENINIIG